MVRYNPIDRPKRIVVFAPSVFLVLIYKAREYYAVLDVAADCTEAAKTIVWTSFQEPRCTHNVIPAVS